uniref:DNA polymerase epsilon subunit 3 n=1 Tax=Pseudodiaptomus poplesia TaxID=213370 RepID=A0A1S6GLC2_9MAXI|nr:DNA polymerase epsilon subunit 3 [Pseudodiaptomus poplesia]
MAERPEDLNLPASVVTKIIKDCLPSGCKVSKEANAAIVKAASVFVLYATASANGIAQNGKRKTISGQDVIKAMTEMEFDKFVRPLEHSMAAWKKGQKDKKDSAAKKKAETVKEKKDDDKDKEKEKEEDKMEVVEVEDNKEKEEDDDEVTIVEEEKESTT